MWDAAYVCPREFRAGVRHSGLSPCQQMPDIGAVSTPTPLADTTLRKAIILLSMLAVGALLYFAQDVFIPVAVSLFLALLLTPAVDRLQRWRVPRGLAVAIVLLVVFAAAGAAINAVWTPATRMAGTGAADHAPDRSAPEAAARNVRSAWTMSPSARAGSRRAARS